MAAWHRQRRVLLRVSRAAWRLEQAERERSWALASARAEGISIRTLASAAGLSPARVHQITAAADMDELDAALGGLRAAGWPAPEDPDGDDDAELDGRDLICDRLLDEAGWLRQCAGWLTHLHTKGFPSAVNLRPEGDHPDRAHVVADLPRVAAILQRVAADIDELARARRVADLAAAVLGDRRAERRRRAAEPDLDFREFCRRSKLPQSERSWDLFAAERYRRGETGIPSYEAYCQRSANSLGGRSRNSAPGPGVDGAAAAVLSSIVWGHWCAGHGGHRTRRALGRGRLGPARISCLRAVEVSGVKAGPQGRRVSDAEQP